MGVEKVVFGAAFKKFWETRLCRIFCDRSLVVNDNQLSFREYLQVTTN